MSDYPNAPSFRGDFFTRDLFPPQRRERGITYWDHRDGGMIYYCPDDITEEHDADYCRTRRPERYPQTQTDAD